MSLNARKFQWDFSKKKPKDPLWGKHRFTRKPHISTEKLIAEGLADTGQTYIDDPGFYGFISWESGAQIGDEFSVYELNAQRLHPLERTRARDYREVVERDPGYDFAGQYDIDYYYADDERDEESDDAGSDAEGHYDLTDDCDGYLIDFESPAFLELKQKADRVPYKWY